MVFWQTLGLGFLFFMLSSLPAWGKTIKVPENYPKIQQAIDAAQTGDTVLVAPGRYNEQLVMKEGIALKSDSADSGDELVNGPGQKKVLRRAQRTIIDGTGYPGFTDAKPMVEFPAGITRATLLDGFTITKMPEVNHTLPGHAHTLQCRGSSPVIRNNIVIDNGSSGIGSHARFKEGELVSPKEKLSFENIAHHAHPLIEKNVFAENIGAGIGNNHYSYATLVNNEVFGNISKHDHPAPGIGIQHGAHPLVVGNLVHDNDWTGIACRKGAQPVNRRTNPIIKDNTVMNNGRAGVEEHGAGIGADGTGYADDPMTIVNNVIHGNLAAGIGMRNGAFVVATGNVSYENDMAGIGMDSSTALVKENSVYNNKRAGIGCREGQATIQNNEIYQNVMAGIGLDKAKGMIIVKNRIHDNGVSSFWTKVKNFLSSTITSKSLSRGGVGVGMKKSRVLLFNFNTITNNTLPGLALTEGSTVDNGKNNILEKNGSDWAPNLALLDQSGMSLAESIIKEGNTANVYLSESRLTLNNCRLEKAWKPGIVAEQNSSLRIDSGSITNNGAIGVILDSSYGELRGVFISGNAHHGIEAEGNSSIRVENSNIENNGDHGGAGISIERSKAHVTRTLIHHNKYMGVEVDNGSLVLWNNVLADQTQGAEIEGKSLLDPRNNIFANNKESGLETDKPVQIKHLSHNAFWKNGESGAEHRPKILNFLPTPPEGEKEEEKEDREDTEKGLHADPIFVNSAAGDYRLQAGSVLIDAGEDLGLPFTGDAPDIGAIEYK